MKTKMNLSISAAAVLGGFLALGFAVPVSAQCAKGANSSLNLKTVGCETTVAVPTFGGGFLAVAGDLKLANSGKGPATVSNVVARLQIKSGKDWTTVANAIATTCGADAKTCSGTVANSTGATLSAAIPVTAGASTGVACDPASTAVVPFNVSFPAIGAGYSLKTGDPVRIELLATYDGATSGCPNNGCVAGSCGYNRDVTIRFGFQVP